MAYFYCVCKPRSYIKQQIFTPHSYCQGVVQLLTHGCSHAAHNVVKTAVALTNSCAKLQFFLYMRRHKSWGQYNCYQDAVHDYARWSRARKWRGRTVHANVQGSADMDLRDYANVRSPRTLDLPDQTSVCRWTPRELKWNEWFS